MKSSILWQMPQEEMPGFVRVDHRWGSEERWNAVRCRLGRFGERSRVAPGLYALGRPGPESAAVATASYRLSFDVLRRGLTGVDCWILVTDTKGLDVASAASAGRFSTDEIATRVLASRLSRVVRHRRLILPMRAAAAVDPAALARVTGFDAVPGPERASDLPGFLSGLAVPGRRFGVLDALVLTPAELGRSLLRFPGFAFAALLFAGLGPAGVSLDRALGGSWPLLVTGLAAIVCGSLVAPLLHAAASAVPLWAAGAAAGLAGTAALMEGVGLSSRLDAYLQAACWLFFPAASAWMAEQFRRAMPLSAPTEPRVPAAVLTAAAALIALLTLTALVLSKATRWG
jgi:hypothetical protein